MPKDWTLGTKTLIYEYGGYNPFNGFLRTAKEMAQIIPLSEKRLKDLANEGVLPHARIDNGEPLFIEKQLCEFLKDKMIYCHDGSEIPFSITILKDGPSIEDYSELPKPLWPMSKKLKRLDHWVPPCIYFLILGEEIVYIGKSTNVILRLTSHAKDKTFDRIYYVDVPEGLLEKVEGALIRLFKPKLNCKDENNYHCAVSNFDEVKELIQWDENKKHSD